MVGCLDAVKIVYLLMRWLFSLSVLLFRGDPVPPGNSIVLLTCPFCLRGWCCDGWLNGCCSRSFVC
jgi:hypothetical protein